MLTHRATEVPGPRLGTPPLTTRLTNQPASCELPPLCSPGWLGPVPLGPPLRWCWAAYCLNGRRTAASLFGSPLLGWLGPAFSRSVGPLYVKVKSVSKCAALRFLGQLWTHWLGPALLSTPSRRGTAKPGSGPLDHWAAVKRLALMEFDVRPHEPYDVAISGIFIAVMLALTLLIFALA